MDDHYLSACIHRENPCKLWKWQMYLDAQAVCPKMEWFVVYGKSRKMDLTKSSILLLSQGRRLWFLRMEEAKDSCDVSLHRAI
jgi:hypothetical protein